jgi:YD repeat-containing protein
VPTKIPSIEIDWQAIREELKPYISRTPEFAERFSRLPEIHAKLKPAVLAQVKTWKCYTFSIWDLAPSSFLLSGYRPGRRITDPAPGTKVLRYGYDADERIIAEDRPSNSQESFWEYHPDRIDGIATSTSSPPDSRFFRYNVESLFLKNGQPIWYFKYGRRGYGLRLFRYENERIVQVLSAYTLEDLIAIGIGKDQWVYEFADIKYDAKGDAHVRRFSDFQKGGEAFIYKMPKRTAAETKVPLLDVRKDVEDTLAAIERSVKKFAAKQPKTFEPVSGIGLGFFAFENPEVIIRFDTRPKFEPDGEWSYPEFTRLKRARWNRFIETCEDAGGKGTVIDAHGNRHEIMDILEEKRFVNWLGEALVMALKNARQAGVFNDLKKAARCELNVEEAGDGEFGWPKYKERGKENLL